MQRLGNLLVQAGLIDAALVEDLIQSMSLYGGSFDTNLLEMGVIDEPHLQPFLERAFGIRNRVNVFELPSADATRVLKRAQAEQYQVVPVRLTGRTVDVVTLDPTDMGRLDEIGFVTGCRVVPNVVTEMRLAFHFHTAYGAPLEARFESLLAGKAWPKPEIVAKRAKAEAARTKVEEPELSDVMPAIDVDIDLAGINEIAAPPAMPLGTQPPGSLPLPPRATTGTHAAISLPPVPIAAAPPPVYAAPQAAPVVQAPPPPPPPQPPIVLEAPRRSYDVIAAQLAGTTDRDQIPPIALGYLSTLLSRAILFAVKKNQLAGWDERGRRLRRELVEPITLGLDRPSIFARSISSGIVYEGPLPQDAVEETLMLKLGAATDWPAQVMLVPIKVKDRVVALLYGDTSSPAAMAEAREPVGVIADLIAEALIRLILSKKG